VVVVPITMVVGTVRSLFCRSVLSAHWPDSLRVVDLAFFHVRAFQEAICCCCRGGLDRRRMVLYDLNMPTTNSTPEVSTRRKAYTTPRIEDHGALDVVTAGVSPTDPNFDSTTYTSAET
jgi:hypothetical protein